MTNQDFSFRREKIDIQILPGINVSSKNTSMNYTLSFDGSAIKIHTPKNDVPPKCIIYSLYFIDI